MIRIISLIMMCLLHISCSQIYRNEIIGNWENSEEGIKLELAKDSTFSALNLPLDVVNKNFILQKKGYNISGKGKWRLSYDELRLSFNEREFYSFKCENSNTLSLLLTEESGGTSILVHKTDR